MCADVVVFFDFILEEVFWQRAHLTGLDGSRACDTMPFGSPCLAQLDLLVVLCDVVDESSPDLFALLFIHVQSDKGTPVAEPAPAPPMLRAPPANDFAFHIKENTGDDLPVVTGFAKTLTLQREVPIGVLAILHLYKKKVKRGLQSFLAVVFDRLLPALAAQAAHVDLAPF